MENTRATDTQHLYTLSLSDLKNGRRKRSRSEWGLRPIHGCTASASCHDIDFVIRPSAWHSVKTLVRMSAWSTIFVTTGNTSLHRLCMHQKNKLDACFVYCMNVLFSPSLVIILLWEHTVVSLGGYHHIFSCGCLEPESVCMSPIAVFIQARSAPVCHRPGA